MSITSVNTNTSAFVALENLTQTSNLQQFTQNRISTGLKVASAKDDSAAFQIAQTLRADLSGISAVGDSLNRAKSTLDVAISGAQSISDLLVQARGLAASVQDTGLDNSSRAAIATDFKNLVAQLDSVVKQSEFNGTNLLKANPDEISAITAVSGGLTSTVSTIHVAGFEADSKASQAGVTYAAGTTVPVTAGSSLSSLLTGKTGGVVAQELVSTAFTTSTPNVNIITAAAAGGSGTTSFDTATGKINLQLSAAFTTAAPITVTIGGVAFTTNRSIAANTTGAVQNIQLTSDDFTAVAGGTFTTTSAFNNTTSTGAQLSTLDFTKSVDRAAGLAIVDQFAKALNDQLSTFGSASRQLDLQITFAQKLNDNVQAGIGNIVDANLPQESAKLQGLNVRQQLGVQALSLANQGPQAILSLFR